MRTHDDDDLKAFMAALDSAPVTPDRPADTARDLWWRSRMERAATSDADRALERGVAVTVGLTTLGGLGAAAAIVQPGLTGVLLMAAFLGLAVAAVRELRRS